MKTQMHHGRLGRRQLLLGTAALAVAGAAPLRLLAAVPAGTEDRFLAASRLLVNHRLDPLVSARMAEFAQAEFEDLDALLGAVIGAAEASGSDRVEDFFDDLPEGPVRDFAYWTIAAWYRGSSSETRDATLFTYEQALLYQPTRDMVAIPSFGFSAPNAWGRDLYPLTDLPRF